jgi:sigma-B regulation protein RsbU (phosphoserine phosphatase)
MLAVLLVFEYRDDMNRAVLEREAGLADEAIAVHQAVSHLSVNHSAKSAQDFITQVCDKMQRTHSPRHAILVQRGKDTLHSSADGAMTADAVSELLSAFRRGIFRVQLQGNLTVLGGYEDNGTVVIVTELATNLRRSARREVLWQMGMLAILALTAAVIMGIVLWRLIRSPLQRMSATVDTIACGRFGMMLESPVGRELQDLTRSFNTMSAVLATNERRRHREMQRTREIQQHLLPVSISVPGLSIACEYHPAEDLAGDYYDFIPLRNGSWLMVIADVTGHGIAAAMAATILKALLLCEADNNTAGHEILGRVNRRLVSLLPTGLFVTVLLAVWHPDTRSLNYVNAGHPPGLLWNARVGFRELASSALPAGLLQTDYDAREISVEADDRLIFVTDGLIEAASPAGMMFGMDRLKQVITNHPTATAPELLNEILTAVRTFCGDCFMQDDLTLLIAIPSEGS